MHRIAAASVGTAVLLAALATPASAAAVPSLPAVGGLQLCKTLHGIPIAGAVGDFTCDLVDNSAVGGFLGPIISKSKFQP